MPVNLQHLRGPRWFEDRSQYTESTPIPKQIDYDKLSLIRVFESGKTQPGWGAQEFMQNYLNNAFDPQHAIRYFEKYHQPFAIVMRSVPLVCIDIDGKNGGIQTAKSLDLPPTLAETSKSGNGFHLFYRVPYSNWGSYGFSEYPDIIGLLPGIDVKGTGVVFHYPTQQWNTLDVGMLPPTLMEHIGTVRDVRRAARVTATGVQDMSEDDLVVLWADLLKDLGKKIEVGNRNERLYALGARLFASGYQDWARKVFDRGIELGLSPEELNGVLENIEKYS